MNHTHEVSRSVAPSESEYCNAKVCDAPLPELGVTLSAVMTATTDGTVQSPRSCQPLFLPDALSAYMKMFFAPPNAGLRVIARFTVKVLPLGEAPLEARAIEH